MSRCAAQCVWMSSEPDRKLFASVSDLDIWHCISLFQLEKTTQKASGRSRGRMVPIEVDAVVMQAVSLNYQVGELRTDEVVGRDLSYIIATPVGLF